MTPALSALKRALPDGRIDVLLEDRFAPLLDGHPAVDRVLSLGPTFGNRLSLAGRISRSRYDAVFNFHGGPTSALFTAASAARLRVGRDTYRWSFVYNLKAEPPERVFAGAAVPHTVHYQSSLVASLGIAADDFTPTLTVSAAARARAGETVRGLGLPPWGYVLMQPTASFETKRWPAERFVAVAREIEKSDSRVLVSLPEGTDENLKGLFSRFATVSGLSLGDLVGVLSFARLYFGNDSGPMHVAAALGVPIVGIFGSSDPRRWHPWGVPYRALWAGLPCSPCHGKSCANPDSLACLRALTTTAAIDAALELLGGREARQ